MPADAGSAALRVREHIEWAASHGCLDAVCAFLRDLPETSWLHLGEYPAK